MFFNKIGGNNDMFFNKIGGNTLFFKLTRIIHREHKKLGIFYYLCGS